MYVHTSKFYTNKIENLHTYVRTYIFKKENKKILDGAHKKQSKKIEKKN